MENVPLSSPLHSSMITSSPPNEDTEQRTMASNRNCLQQQQPDKKIVDDCNSEDGPVTTKIPRSIRWRIQLGLLELPKSYDNNNNDNASSSLEVNELMSYNKCVIEQHHTRYKNCRKQYLSHLQKIPMEVSKNNDDIDDDDDVDDGGDDDDNDSQEQQREEEKQHDMLDPLTAMFMEQKAKEDRRQELDLKYRKERARMKRGLESKRQQSSEAQDETTVDDDGVHLIIDRDALSIIDKDLNRLPSPDTCYLSSLTAIEQDEQLQQRRLYLREILYIFSQQHKYIGYRQGMHEIASYLLYVVQKDHNKNLSHDEHDNNNNRENSNNGNDDNYFTIDIKANAYFLLECILKRMEQAFDIKISSNSKPLEEMTASILQKVKKYDDMVPYTPTPTISKIATSTNHKTSNNIYPVISSLPVPPQLYCTKWIRLLFSREVVGLHNILQLWDVFIELVAVANIDFYNDRNSSTTSSKNLPPIQHNNNNRNAMLPSGFKWMTVLETTAACRILLSKDILLNSHNNEENCQSQTIHLLMNMQPLTDIQPLVKKLRFILHNDHYNINQYGNNSSNITATGALPQQFSSMIGKVPNLTTTGTISQQQQQQQQRMDGTLSNSNDNSFLAVQSMKKGIEQLTSQGDTIRQRLYNEFEKHITTATTSIPTKAIFPTGSPLSSSLAQTNAAGSASAGGRNYTDPLFAALEEEEEADGINIYFNSQSSSNQTFANNSLTQQQQLSQNQHQQITSSQSVVITPSPLSSVQAVASTPSIPTAAPRNYNNNVQTNIAQTSAATVVGVHQQLANQLSNSVAELQQFVMSVEQNNQQLKSVMMMNNSSAIRTAVQGSAIPPSVWEALADVELVRKKLLELEQQGR